MRISLLLELNFTSLLVIFPICQLVGQDSANERLPADAGSRPAAGSSPPRQASSSEHESWVDPDTGHRISRLTKEPGSRRLYFNLNCFSPDGKYMVYTYPKGISVVNLFTNESKELVAGGAKAIEVGRSNPNIYFSLRNDDGETSRLLVKNIISGETVKSWPLPPRSVISSINSLETFGAGYLLESDESVKAPNAPINSGKISANPRALNVALPQNRGRYLAERFNARLPMSLFLIDLRSGAISFLMQHTTDWINHIQFSPSDPHLLMYCHEGPWQYVDRIWTIRIDGSENTLIHRRMMQMEMAGHEWWSSNGDCIFYQLHFPWGGDVNYIASFNHKNQRRTWLQYDATAASIHHSSSADNSLFCGDGNTKSPWIVLLRPKLISDRGTLGVNLINYGELQCEKLVNLAKHNFNLEPNATFTPDGTSIIFQSNILGPDFVFKVDVK